MYPRLKLARDLLSDDGVIFISIDDNEQANLKLMCDEIFGEENFVAQCTWRKTDNQVNIGQIVRVKEYVIGHAKDIDLCHLKKMKLTERAKKEYRYSDKKGKFRRSILLDKTRGEHVYDVKTPSGNILSGHWVKTEKVFKEILTNNGIYWTSGRAEQPYGKIHLHDIEGQIANDFLSINYGTNQQGSLEVEEILGARYFDFPKPSSLIKHFLEIVTASDNLVLDFFAASGTTAHVAMELNKEDGGNRKFSLVQWDEATDPAKSKPTYDFCKENKLETVISSICIERVNLAGEKIRQEVKILL